MSNQQRKSRRRERKQQLKINSSLKKRLYRDVVFAPCFYCKKIFLIENLTIEHLIPRSYGGTNDDSNIAIACSPCNHHMGRVAWFVKKYLTAIKCHVKNHYEEQHSAQHFRKD